MPIILWDASGLVKRYYPEMGTPAVFEIFRQVPPSRMCCTFWGYAEVFAILHRKRNGGTLSNAAFTKAATKLQDEVFVSSDFGVLTIEDDRVLAGLALVVKHNLNSNDAAILATYLRFQASLPVGSPACLLAAADQRLIRASEAEGLETLNPERLSADEVTGLLAKGAA